MHRSPLSLVLVSLCLGLLPQSAGAQAEIAWIYVMTPKMGMGAEFQTALRQHVQWRAENGDPWTWGVYEIVNGDNVGTFIARSGDHEWADFDTYDAGFGPRGATNFWATVGPLIEGNTSQITMTDTANARWPENADEYVMFQLITLHLKPAHVEEFTQLIGKFHEAILKTNWPAHYAWTYPLSGGMGPTATLVLPFRNWADFEEPETSFPAMLAQAYGDEEATALLTAYSNCYTHSETSILRFRPELSVMPRGM